jgi:hypothetical protein
MNTGSGWACCHKYGAASRTARMSRAFPRSRTVTYAGGQHVTWAFAGSACVDDVANTYMLTGQLPLADVGCSNSAG